MTLTERNAALSRAWCALDKALDALNDAGQALDSIDAGLSLAVKTHTKRVHVLRLRTVSMQTRESTRDRIAQAMMTAPYAFLQEEDVGRLIAKLDTHPQAVVEELLGDATTNDLCGSCVKGAAVRKVAMMVRNFMAEGVK